MEGRDQSEFNMAVNYLYRLNVLFYMADSAAIDLDATSWYHTLMGLYRELSTEMTTQEREEIENQFTQINQHIIRNQKTSFRTGRKEIRQELYKKLQSAEIELRKILKSAGLQQKMVDDARNALR